MQLKVKLILILLYISLGYFSFNPVFASTLHAISVQNGMTQSTVTIQCNTVPLYTIFSLHNPERIVVDLSKIFKICQKNTFPMQFIGNNLISRIRAHSSINCRSMRIVCDLHCKSDIISIIQKQVGKNYCIVLTISKKMTIAFNNNKRCSNSVTYHNAVLLKEEYTGLHKKTIKKLSNTHKNVISYHNMSVPIVVAIDAGHGGHDPGATGDYGIYEKNITFNIARRLKKMLDSDPMFKAVMIRDGDYFLSVMDRSDLARKKKANILVSIHVDSALNTHVRGASVWVLSSRRAKSETMLWLHRQDKYAELLGGLGDILINYRNDPYFNHLVLDLQFGYAQREGYTIAMQILNQLKDISFLHKSIPEYSSFGVLRSPDIPSVLVETGFISNLKEACLLATNSYQEKIAYALYKGLCAYILEYKKNIVH